MSGFGGAEWYRSHLRAQRLFKPHPIYEFYKPGYPYKPDTEYVRKTGAYTVPGRVYNQFKTVWGWTVYSHHQGRTIDEIIQERAA